MHHFLSWLLDFQHKPKEFINLIRNFWNAVGTVNVLILVTNYTSHEFIVLSLIGELLLLR